MLQKVSIWRHVVVGLAVVVMALLAGSRIIGAGADSLIRPEQFDAKQVTIWPDGDDGVRIREVVDIDFGITERRGYQRIVRNDFGVPVDVTAESPTANDGLVVVDTGAETRIRIGDPEVTFTGRHRYVLEYTLPAAGVSSGVVFVDVIGNDETFATRRFEVVVTGFDDPLLTCDTGAYDAFGGCEFEADGSGNRVAVIEPLLPGDGITVGIQFSGLGEPVVPPLPPLPEPLPSGFAPLGLLMIPLGVAAAAAVFLLGRSYGSNTVLAGGAAEAAFGDLPLPGQSARSADVPTYRVPDSRLAELATIEFVPPRGLEPWQAAAVLRERIDDDTVAAWFSEMIATDALVITDDDGTVELRPGPDTARLSAVDRAHLQRLFAGGDVVTLGSYDPAFGATWSAIRDEQRSFVGSAGWWSHGGPGGRSTTPARAIAIAIAVLVVIGIGVLVVTAIGSDVWLAVSSPWIAIVAGILVPLVVAAGAYHAMFPSRTATGSALALRAESFRRFLAASEGKHVEWAWQQGLLREYSAWAVALGAADAWTNAIRSSNVAEPQVALAGPLLVHAAASSFSSARTAPSSSGGGGGGGGVGGGGGGGSSGSW
ncbi:MAG TPA: hypothetical protein VK853_05140 [Ilumatobacteraceae bacterium]|nr:hypothetical protein [Ilumatobacteraceae bacterium]